MAKPRASKSNRKAKSAGGISFKGGKARKVGAKETDEEIEEKESLATKERRRVSRRKKLKKVAPYMKTLSKSLSGKKGGSSKSSDKPAMTDYQLAQTHIQKAILS
jgi:hypothetical protein